MTEYQDNSQKFYDLREKFPVFCYKGFTIAQEEKGIEIVFDFRCGDYCFAPKQTYEAKEFWHNDLDEQGLSLLAFNLGMVEMISYWKAFCSPLIEVECGQIGEEQKEFWKKLYKNGLGEFLYLNGLKDYKGEFVRFECKGEKREKKSFALSEDYLVPIGGGKDSVCSLELLRGKGKDIVPLIVNTRLATTQCVERAGFKLGDCFTIRRTLDPLLLELNAKGFLNGHTPFSAMLAFSTLIAAALSKRKYIALSNENSASENTVKGYEINHQYSKSLEFENDFRSYCKNHISEDFYYFSLLRPISELRIAKIFSSLQYEDVFKSCNVGSKKDLWCGHCPKCLFAFVILSPFLFVERLEKIFGANLFKDESLLGYLQELMGEKEVKPFECVGTIGEVNVALAMRIERFGVKEGEVLLNYWTESRTAKEYLGKNFESLLKEQSLENNLPEDLSSIFEREYSTLCKARIAREYKGKKVAIMGMGREGRSTYRLFKEILPKQSLIVFDKNPRSLEELKAERENFVKSGKTARDVFYCKEDDYKKIDEQSELIFLAPGIAPKNLHEIDLKKISNQCDLFLRLFSRQCIGVSGTKGKSTTVSLIYETIRKQKENCVLCGNIGTAFFEMTDLIDEKTTIVLELSCHQLQHIKTSPHISVLLNLYEEHLDHYLSYEDYIASKMNLLYKAGKDDVFIYNRDNEELLRHVKNYCGECKNLQSFTLSDYVYENPLYLKGEHNKLNILACLKAVGAAGLDVNTALKTAREFKGLRHRLEHVADIDGVSYYNDSISTIPQATLAALQSLKNVSVLILGGMDRGIDYSFLKDVVLKYKVKHIAFVGKAGRRMAQIILNEDKDLDYVVCEDWEKIVSWAKAKATPGSSVLLSPAASSYDQFVNFEHRGRTFSELVLEKR